MKRLIVLSVTVLAMVTGILALVVVENPKLRVQRVQKRFGEMPNVKIEFISDLTKQASDSVSATIEVVGKGRIGFAGLSTASFRHSSHVYLAGIGDYGFRTRELVGDQEAYGYAIDVGIKSPIPEVRKLGITGVQSAVAHFDDLKSLVAQWPVTTNEWPTRWPLKPGQWSNRTDEEVHFSDLPHSDYYFCLKR
jgi:hypothetical protein